MSISPDLQREIEQAKILLVGAGGIGCEVLKNLTLTGFKSIDAVDLDTIDVSNLNRQFLFNKSNVGQSKSKVAIEIAKKEYTPSTDGLLLNSIHNSIMSSEFDVDFFKQYSIVINALDNRAARSHVNRMCLSAEVPLLESGTAGYTGQSKLIKNALTSCYECDGIQKEGRTYPTCTIRNTPSQPIHCIVWAKHLFHQLFGEDDPDNDVSPQLAHNYDPLFLIQKLYNDDIEYLLTMDNLWKERAKPTPLEYHNLIQDEPQCSKTVNNDNLNQRVWTPKECVDTFSDCVRILHQRLKTSGFQQWDKDDETALDFVVAASNLRSLCFNIERKSPFDVKSLAGNIVPAISSTNSIIGGLIVLQAIRLLKKDTGKVSYLNYTSLARKDLIASYDCPPPVPNCLACGKGNRPEVEIHLSMQDTTLADLVDKIVIGTFYFVCPDLGLNDDSGIIIWSKDDGDDEAKKKKLVDLPHIKPPKTRLLVSDLLQDKEIVFVLIHEEVDEETHKNFFYAQLNGKDLTV